MIKALENFSNRITVNYENKPCYDIVLAPDFMNILPELEKLNVTNKRICIVTESNVGPLYAEELKELIGPHCKKIIVHQFEAGEPNKNVDTVNKIYKTLIDNQFDRNDLLLALGGGVTGDITGFTAATYLRGIDFVQIPTTLLAQSDSSIGGKTGVDFEAYKNMVGAFYMPKLVYMNISTLKSLPMREYLSGMGEVIKHGFIRDNEFLYWLKENKDNIINRDYETMAKMVFVNCNIKRVVVENDPKEKGERAVLNLGHTIGHAVEKLKDFTLLHGECVTVGMSAAAYLSYKKGYITKDEYEFVNKTILDFDLPITTTNLVSEEVVAATLNDKKMDSGVIKFVLLENLGYAIIDRTLTQQDLLEAVNTVINRG